MMLVDDAIQREIRAHAEELGLDPLGQDVEGAIHKARILWENEVPLEEAIEAGKQHLDRVRRDDQQASDAEQASAAEEPSGTEPPST